MWAAIGCAVGVAVLVVAAAVLLLYRRRQRVRQHHLVEEGPAAAWPRAESKGYSSAGGSGEAAGFSRADPAVVVMEAGSPHASEGVEGWLGRPLEEPAADLGAAIYHTRWVWPAVGCAAGPVGAAGVLCGAVFAAWEAGSNWALLGT